MRAVKMLVQRMATWRTWDSGITDTADQAVAASTVLNGCMFLVQLFGWTASCVWQHS